MPKSFTWTRQGREIYANGERAFYLEPCRDANGRGPIAPYEADCVAMQLHNALARGVLGVPKSLKEYDTLAAGPEAPPPADVRGLARALVDAIDRATVPELEAARKELSAFSKDYANAGDKRTLARSLSSLIRGRIK